MHLVQAQSYHVLYTLCRRHTSPRPVMSYTTLCTDSLALQVKSVHRVRAQRPYHPVRAQPTYHPVRAHSIIYHPVRAQATYHPVRAHPIYHPVRAQPT